MAVAAGRAGGGGGATELVPHGSGDSSTKCAEAGAEAKGEFSG